MTVWILLLSGTDLSTRTLTAMKLSSEHSEFVRSR